MVGHDNGPADPEGLRAAAEERLAEREIDLGALSGKDVRALVHDLQVHQIELELQTEEMRRAYGELDSLRADLDDLYQSAPVGYVTLRPDGLILKANRAAAEILGTDPGTLKEARFYRFVLPQDQELYFAHRRRLKTSGDQARCTLRILAGDDRVRDIRLDSVPKVDGAGRVVAYRTTLIDITDLKLTERELRVADSVIQATSEAVVIMDAEGGFSAVNPAFSRLTGLNSGDAAQRTIRDCVDPPSADKLRTIWEALQKKGHWTGELAVSVQDGEFAPVWAALSAVKEANGLVSRVRASSRHERTEGGGEAAVSAGEL